MARKNSASAVARSQTPHPVLGARVPEAGGQEAADRTLDASSPEPDDLPADLVEELGRLLGQALAADIRQYPNLAEWKASQATTVESPPGLNRTAPRERRVYLSG